MKKFIYFPSFSVGNYAPMLKRDDRLNNNIPVRFYSNEFPEHFRHPYFLVTAGHFYKQANFASKIGFTDVDDMILLGDSGGFQIASGAIKWDPSLKHKMLTWLEENSHIAMNLDIPPRIKYEGRVRECLDISKENFKYFADHQTGKTKFLNVLQGIDETSYMAWYNEVKEFPFRGWGIGGCGGSLYRFMCGIMTLMENLEHYKDNVEYIHILGTSKVIDFFILAQLQKSLADLNTNITVTTDSSTPSRAVVYGLYYYDMNMRKGNFQSFHIPKDRAENNKNQTKHSTNSITQLSNDFLLPKACEFDSYLEGAYTFDDLKNWTNTGYASVILHNFMFFKDAMEKITSYVNGHPYFLEQSCSSDIFMVLKSIDEMVWAKENGTTAYTVFKKYQQLYMRMSAAAEYNEHGVNDFF